MYCLALLYFRLYWVIVLFCYISDYTELLSCFVTFQTILSYCLVLLHFRLCWVIVLFGYISDYNELLSCFVTFQTILVYCLVLLHFRLYWVIVLFCYISDYTELLSCFVTFQILNIVSKLVVLNAMQNFLMMLKWGCSKHRWSNFSGRFLCSLHWSSIIGKQRALSREVTCNFWLYLKMGRTNV